MAHPLLPVVRRQGRDRLAATRRRGRVPAGILFETLEPRLLLAANVILSEFMAINDGGLVDEDGENSDWIELHNAGDMPQNLDGWYLTDDAADLTKWRFPAVTLDPGAFVIVFASDKDRAVAGQELHANFRLTSGGEYLGLVEADGTTIAAQFAPAFPQQFENVSYGVEMASVQLVGPAAAVEYLVPTDDSLEPAWRAAGFDHPSLVRGETQSSSSLVITEVSTGAVDSVEIQNVAGQTVDTSGWFVAFNNAAGQSAAAYSELVRNDPGLTAYWRLGENVTPAGSTATHGQPLANRAFQDSFHGTAVHNSPIVNPMNEPTGRVTQWSFYNDNPGAIGLQITPVLLEKSGANYIVRGIGATRTVTGAGVQTHAFAVASGTDTFDWDSNTFHMGVRYGSPTVSNTGVVEFDNGANQWSFYGDATPVGPISVGSPLSGLCGGCGALGRDYSMQFTIESTAGGPGTITAVDDTGNHHGTYSATGAQGGQGGAIVGDANTSVDFSGGEVSVPHSAALNSGGGALTVEAWVRLDSTGAFQWILGKDSSNGAATPGLDYLLGVNADGRFRFITQGLNHDVLSANPATADGNTWHHVVGVQNPAAGTVALYVDGQIAGSTALTTSGVTSTAPLSIGDRSAGGGGQLIDGRLDEVALYHRALSVAEVEQHYLAGRDLLQGGVNKAHATVWNLPATVAADQVIVRSDDAMAGGQYVGADIAWDTAGPGWAMIVDDAGEVVDFAAWGYTSGDLAGLTVQVNGRTVTVGEEWSGGGTASMGAEGVTLQRQGDFDHDDAGDFVWQASSAGATNAGLTVPFDLQLLPNHGGVGYALDGGATGAGETIGPAVISRPITDTASGSVFLLDNHRFTRSGTVSTWSIYSTNTLNITPLIFHFEEGEYEIHGIGQTRQSNGGGIQTFDFNLQSGSADVEGGGDYYFGWMDGSNFVNNTGVIGWDDQTPDTIRWFGGNHAGNLVAGNAFEGGQTFPRSYSLQVTTTSGLSGEFNTDVEAAMHEQATSLYVRYPFTSDGPQSVTSMTLRVRYDDGFIAYLNGVEIARRNAPAAATFNGVAPLDRSVEDAAAFEEINVTAFISHLIDGQNVLALHGFNEAIDSGEFLIDAQLTATGGAASFVEGYFDEPTPGSPNASSFAGFVGDTAFDVDRGFFNAPFMLTITTPATPDADIYYTTNGSTPGPSNPAAILYTGPIPISSTTTLRAAGYKGGLRPTNIDTQTYLFVNDVVQSGVMHNSILNNATWGPQLDDALLALPTISLVTPNTISQAETGTSLEMIYPDGTAGFQVDAGVEHFGGTSLGFSKKSMRISFKAIYGPTRLNEDLFGDGATNEFDQILLRSGSHDTLFYTHGNGMAGVYVRNRWAFDRQLEMGHDAPHGQFVHVYINGTYWGLYELMERPNAAFMASYQGGEKEDYDAINAGSAVDGDLTAWNTLLNNTTNFSVVEQYLDLQNYVDYMLLNFYAGNDWDWNHFQNWMAARQRTAGAGFNFFSWDSDMMLRTGVNADVIHRGGPGNMWAGLSQHPAIRQLVIDRAQTLFFNDGMFTRDRVLGDLSALADEVRIPLIAETARWGGGGYTPDTWQLNLSRVFNEIVDQRTEVVIQQLRNYGFFPLIDAPTFHVDGQPLHGGQVDAGDMLTMTVPAIPRTITTTFVAANAPAAAIVPANNNMSTAWRNVGYVQGTHGETWIAGTNGVGYENDSGYQSLISINVGPSMFGPTGNNTVYVRLPFNVADPDDLLDLDRLTLRVLADDGFVAYLNGQKVASANAPADISLTYNSAATVAGEVSLNNPAVFDLTGFIPLLTAGQNVLALHGLNASTTSSDMLIHATLVGEVDDPIPSQGDIFFTTDGSDPMTGGTLFTAPVPLTRSTLVKARQFDDGQWSALSEALFTVDLPLRITEIHYNPAGDDATEFIELMNVGPVALDLTGVKFIDGVEYEFLAGEANLLLPAGGRIVIVADRDAFAAAYPGVSASAIADRQFDGSLNNAGETLILADAAGAVIHDFDYLDTWLALTDGAGPSLDLIDPSQPDRATWGVAASWRASGIDGGTPGRADPVVAAIPGDVNYNNIVDIGDLSRLAVNFGLDGSADPLIDVRWQHGDVNGDRRVNITDLSILASRFGQSAAQAAVGEGADLLAEAAVPRRRSAVALAPAVATPTAADDPAWAHIADILHDAD